MIAPRETSDRWLPFLHAFWVKVRHEKNLYWPEYHGPKVYPIRSWKNAAALEEHRQRVREQRHQ